MAGAGTTEAGTAGTAGTGPADPSRQWALVTGGARRLGAAIAEHLHGRGLNVMIHCLGSLEAAGILAERLVARRPASAVVLQADLGQAGASEALAEQVRTVAPHLALLVNNASRFYPTPFGAVDGECWKDLMGSNVRGAFFLSQALASSLAGGAIVNIVDIYARRPLPGYPVYSMAKATLEMMTRSLAVELAPDIRVNGVAPGAILWPEGDQAVDKQEAVLSRVALRRLGTPEDIAGAVAFLGLDAPYVTGQILAVDGGRSLNV
ncbi:MAG: pteridine reductase [Xanthomonadales bacterium]|jgi:pteridine reductase|nr:pteridine reductase [Xanthomonadales bacterium]